MLWLVPLAVAAGTALASTLAKKDAPDYKPQEMPNKEDYEIPNLEHRRDVGNALMTGFAQAPVTYNRPGEGTAMTNTGVKKPQPTGMTGMRRK